MKISVTRIINSEKELVFTITCTEPHLAPFGGGELLMMAFLDEAMDRVKENSNVVMLQEDLQEGILANLHDAKEKCFDRVERSMVFTIDNSLREKFKPMCQEIFNWLYDQQEGVTKEWFEQFKPQRTKYYFDNDPEVQVQHEDFDDD